MPEIEQTRPPFQLFGGHPALDFVNSLDNRFSAAGTIELLGEYRDLVRFAEQAQLLDGRQARQLAKAVAGDAATRVLRAARELREALAATLYGALAGRPPAATDLRTLERHLRAANLHQELHWHARPGSGHAPGMEWSWGRFAMRPELPLWLLAQSAGELLLSDARERVRACDADTCRWLFLDTSKSHTRRWCNMKICGNRMKARRFQARHA